MAKPVQSVLSKFKLPYIPRRYIQCVMLGLGQVVTYINRINISVAIVPMTDSSTVNNGSQEFDWTEIEKGYILSSFYWGYTVTQIPIGILAQYTGPKVILLITNLISTISTILLPAATYCGSWKLLCLLRIILGMCQGGTYPLLYSLSAQWFPSNERSRLLSVISTGGTLGLAIAMPLCGALAYGPGGWPSAFYVTAVITLLWAAAWMWLGADSPEVHKSISIDEKNYIQASNSITYDRKLKIPWKAIFRSAPFWALFFCQVLNGFNLSVYATEIPSFLNGILTLNIVQNSILNAIPRILGVVSILPGGWLADYLINNNILSRNVVRKTWTVLGVGVSNLVMLLLAFSEQDLVLVITILAAHFVLNYFFSSGVSLNTVELSPNFAGIITSITNTVESFVMILGPLIVGLVVSNQESMSQWWSIYLIAVITAMTGSIVFCIFGSTDVQHWNS